MDKKIKKTLIPQYSTSKLKLYTVDPTAVTFHNIKFTNAGHHLVYPEIPNGEVWLSKDLNPAELKYYIYHELLEHSKMLMGLNYDSAHIMANKAEGRLRHSNDLHEVDRLIKKMIDLNRDIITEKSHYNGTLALHQETKLHHQHHQNRHHTEGIKRNSIVSVRR
jgi:hypothetical protein